LDRTEEKTRRAKRRNDFRCCGKTCGNHPRAASPSNARIDLEIEERKVMVLHKSKEGKETMGGGQKFRAKRLDEGPKTN